ncbi:MAG: hypothetical protein QG597_2809 [Actinomycetota bacterium]|nr:hypothetical protein [Actinomycetota bacterium]
MRRNCGMSAILSLGELSANVRGQVGWSSTVHATGGGRWRGSVAAAGRRPGFTFDQAAAFGRPSWPNASRLTLVRSTGGTDRRTHLPVALFVRRRFRITMGGWSVPVSELGPSRRHPG